MVLGGGLADIYLTLMQEDYQSICNSILFQLRLSPIQYRV